MIENKIRLFIKDVLNNMPKDWLNLTTHRLDIYNEAEAKSEFVNKFEALFKANNSSTKALEKLPTAYDYIRLGHPLSCILEWGIAKTNSLNTENVICFSSKAMPILAVLRTNLLAKKETHIYYSDEDFNTNDFEVLKTVYGYNFTLKYIQNPNQIPKNLGSTIFISQKNNVNKFDISNNIDFYIALYKNLGSIILINGTDNQNYISEIQHVRRRESVAITPINSLIALKLFASETLDKITDDGSNKAIVEKLINQITGTSGKALFGSSGLSIQYAIMMGLIDDAQENYKGKAIKFIVPPNCYGGTNDQARRVAACNHNVEIVDLLVDGNHDMVLSIDAVLDKIAKEDAVAYIIAEIPTNPRVEVPNLLKLKEVLTKQRKTSKGENAIDPVFILDQTFCPNVDFLGDGEILSTCKSIAYASGSKFPSGGKCTAGYCVANKKAQSLIYKIEKHLSICDNEATAHQYKILVNQMPSMNQRIAEAYKNTREFVSFIHENLPSAKINFVSEELANQGFTPSVFSLDLPTKGNSSEEKEAYKRKLNLRLINLMITEIPNESKFCVSYGQLKGCYWTIPATSTQGTTKEGDKDYIVRASLAPELDLALHKKVFLQFIKTL
ncbi:MAG: cystathionine beta-synthase [Polaribacter sp.]|uniref:cystathionine beta-synthase n=1 Tax=Polaribacter sp. TaxID=1920175 RepID=UPI003BB09ED5